MKRAQVFACLLLLLCLPALAHATSLQAKVVEIVDGNTMIVINVNRRIKIVLKASAAPEDAQAFGDVARQHLADLVLGKEVLVDYTELGRDGHLVAKVFCNEMDVGQQMIRDGVAWYDRVYEKDLSQLEQQLYEESERAARREHRGLWQEAAPVAPWQFRLAQNAKPPQTALKTVAASAQIGPAQPASARTASALRSGEMGSSRRLRWQKLAPPGEYFSVLIPDEGQQYTSKIPSPPGAQIDTEFFIVNYNGVNYMMMWSTGVDRKRYSIDGIFDLSIAGFKDGLRQLVKRLGPGFACEVNYDKDINMGEYSGRQYTISSCAVPGVMRMFYKINGPKIKLYMASTMLGLEGNPVVDQFFDSFKINKEKNGANADERPSDARPSLDHK
jgi:endonuclease YncB( thermonuclease family)